MTEKAIVVTVQDTAVTVVPYLKDSCSTCTAGCARQGRPFTASNPRKYQLRTGSIVLLTSSRAMQAVQGAVSLLFPFACAVAGYFCAAPIMGKLGMQAADGHRAAFVLGFLVIAGAAVFFLTRKRPLPGKPEIAECLTP